MSFRPIAPRCRPLEGLRARVPASKSIANRELVLSALADGVSRLDLGPLDPGDDVRAMRAGLAALGYEIRDEGGGRLRVTGGSRAEAGRRTLDARDGGTVARFGMALAAVAGGETVVDGSARMRERPIAPLLQALREAGATVDGDRLPVTVRGPLAGGSVTVPGNESSQFASALLLVGPRMAGGLELRLAGATVSAPFVELTVAALAARGVRVERPARGVFRIAPQRVRARSLAVPGDVTAATYPAAAAAILGGEVTIANADARLAGGAQGDARFFALLEAMGCRVRRGAGSVTVSRSGTLAGIAANVNDCSDTFPTLAVVAACAATPTELSGIGHTRRQESDRVSAVAAALRALGGSVTEFADALRIEPAPLHGGVVDSAGDHRIAMAFAVLGLAVPGVGIEGAECVAKTFPEFYDLLDRLAR